jgi:ABC-2 type transport system permease protein
MNVLPIFKKEMRSYFSSLIAYVILTVFLVMSGYLFYGDVTLYIIWGGASATEGLWQQVFHDMRMWMLLSIALLTMRLFAEEKKLGTIELLVTYPFRDIEILLGKYFACLAFVAIMLSLTLLYPILIAIVDRVDIAPLAAGYLGLFLLGSAFIACGIMISSFTENQIVAGLLTLGAFFLFWIIDWNEGVASEEVVNVLHHISLFEHFYNFARGVVETKDIAFYLIFTVFFLFLTLRSLEARRWKGLR